MKKTIFFMVTAVCLLMLSLAGCGQAGDDGKQFTDKDKISIVTTIYPVYDFASNIAGDKAEIINLVPTGVEPHNFELSPKDMQLIEEADLFIYNGAGMENFVDKTLNAIQNENLVIVECAKDITLLESNHSHHEDEHEEEHDGKVDPHTWLSVQNAIVAIEYMKDALITLDKENAQYYEDNYAAYKEELVELDSLYQEELKDLPRDTIVVNHEAFGYLCEAYGIHQVGIEGLSADSEPDSARMKEIVDFCNEEDIRIILFEELVSPKVAQTVASEIGAETMVLNPIGGLTAEQEANGKNYIELMKDNLEVLKTALQ